MSAKIKDILNFLILKTYLRIWLAIVLSLIIVNLLSIYSFSIEIAILLITFSILYIIKILIVGVTTKDMLLCYGCFVSGIFLIVAKLWNLLFGILGALIFLILYFIIMERYLQK